MNLTKSPAEGQGQDMITAWCIPSKESAKGPMLQGISPDRFDPDTGIYLGDPAPPEQSAFLESIAGTLRECHRDGC